MIILSASVKNLREISVKEKFLWLNAKSYLISVFVPFILLPWIDLLSAFLLYLGFLAFFSVLEFFDEDIADIIVAKSKIKTKTKCYRA
ncbi:competence protein ComB [Helicobacter pylori]|uniref:Competence protein ComB n=1 Tax=Helicobacter pylori TaxID=210 RepID=A0AAD1DAP9_HELPX|nr:competence protein ComB [Helicobacter pylori]AVV97043.1 competence protein ComB [Helicobacter pylori]MCQ2878921.1 competence protein ComB [Helicobacter pylori]NHA80934.1 competence protein ComB [Helicobacter pylori]WQW16523.1 competence protein ComB [Helicobacter pylori]SQJ02226.1 ComB3 competence protein [Helicobacter pylori NCTC 11637 = CCUG 17874 = ATCC 43504 = JCM 12093]